MALVSAAQFIPLALLALPAGVWADRLNRKTIIIVSDTVRLLRQITAAVLLLSGNANVTDLVTKVLCRQGLGAHAEEAGLAEPEDGRHRRRISCTVAVDRAEKSNRCSEVKDGRINDGVRRHGLLSARQARRGELRFESFRPVIP